MHTCVSALPSIELRPYVRTFAQREISSGTPEIVEPLPACLESILQFDFGRFLTVEYPNGTSHPTTPVMIIGPHTHRRALIRMTGPIETFGVFFQPLALWQLFRIRISLLVNQAYAGEVLLGKDLRSLWEQMACAATFEHRVRLISEYLFRRLANISSEVPIVSSALRILGSRGTSSVAQIAGFSCMSVRQFERRFLEQIGMAPKLFARIARYQLAMDSKIASPARSWLRIAHEFGYHDQMHMIKDFRSLSGASPNAILLELGDMRPGAVDASSDPFSDSAVC